MCMVIGKTFMRRLCLLSRVLGLENHECSQRYVCDLISDIFCGDMRARWASTSSPSQYVFVSLAIPVIRYPTTPWSRTSKRCRATKTGASPTSGLSLASSRLLTGRCLVHSGRCKRSVVMGPSCAYSGTVIWSIRITGTFDGTFSRVWQMTQER